LEATSKSRAYWTEDERNNLNALIARSSDFAAMNLLKVAGHDAAVPFFDIRDRLALSTLDKFDLEDTSISRYIDLRTLFLCTNEFNRFDSKSLTALRICAGPHSERFPQLQAAAKRGLISTLNNRATKFSSLEAAEEALRRSLELERDEDYDTDLHGHYIFAYANWQAARLTPQHDGDKRVTRSKEAHSLAEVALQLASEQENRHYTEVLGELLNEVERDFPELAAPQVSNATEISREPPVSD
jgi:hypothetical protein